MVAAGAHAHRYPVPLGAHRALVPVSTDGCQRPLVPTKAKYPPVSAAGAPLVSVTTGAQVYA